MIALAALLLAQAAPSIYSNAAASKAALQIFREACTEGQISVPPARGRTLRESELTDFTDVLAYFRRTSTKSVIRFNYPRGTFLIFADYENAQPKGIGRECVVVSRVLSLEDAIRAIIWTAPNIEPRRSGQLWVVDAPKQGFRASVRIRSDRSILVRLSTYAWALAKHSSAPRNQ